LLSTPNKSFVVMVLEDNKALRELLQTQLKQAGYQVNTASHYQEFIQTMVDSDVVLCDIVLPDTDGLQALKWTREHYPHTAVIMMSGKPSYETTAEAIRLGAYDYLSKPVNHEELLHTIERAIQHRQLILEKALLEEENRAYRQSLQHRDGTATLRPVGETEGFLSTLTGNIADAVVSLRLPDFRIEYANRAAFEIFGYQPQELVGQTLELLYKDPTKFEAFSQKQAITVAKGQTVMRLEQPMRRKDDKVVWIEIVATIVPTTEESTQITAVMRDITQRSFLLGVVAHELRAPLGLLTGFAQAMREDIENIDRESLASYLDLIKENGTRMLTMVDELLDITKIELGDVPLQLEPVNIADLLKAHLHDFALVAQKKDITLTKTIADTPLLCQCDPLKVGQVISNFLDNAIKYSAPGSTIELIGQHEGLSIWVGVKDEGPGIKPDELQYLFKGFGHTKISSKPTAGERSTGLGLAICKKIIEAHQGEVGATSVPAQGSTFWFRLPAMTEPADKK